MNVYALQYYLISDVSCGFFLAILAVLASSYVANIKHKQKKTTYRL